MKEAVSIELTESQKARLQTLAEARNATVASLILEGVDLVLEGERQESCYDRVAYLFESQEGVGESELGDLSTNKERLRQIGLKK